MNLIGWLNRKKVGGIIAYCGVERWWTTDFTEDERAWIMEKVGEKLTTGRYTSSASPAATLQGLALSRGMSDDRSIQLRMLHAAESIASDPLDLHYIYLGLIDVYKRQASRARTDVPEAMIEACRRSIQIAPKSRQQLFVEFPNEVLPTHPGYEELISHHTKRGETADAAALMRQAHVEGWASAHKKDWLERIEALTPTIGR